jgi:hypothetical protein
MAGPGDGSRSGGGARSRDEESSMGAGGGMVNRFGTASGVGRGLSGNAEGGNAEGAASVGCAKGFVRAAGGVGGLDGGER